MSYDDEEALDKLAKYRRESKKPEFKPSSEAKVTEENPMRQFFLSYYWFNATVLLTLAFSMLISGWAVTSPVWVISIAFLGLVLARQTFRTITRLERTDGRSTTLDDMFVIILLMGVFFLFSLFEIVPDGLFRVIHLILVVVWVVQIVFVNYLKPELGVSKKSGIIEQTEVFSFTDRVKNYFTKQRSVVFGISLVLASLLSLLVFLS